MEDRLYKYVDETDIRMSPKYFKVGNKIVTNPPVELQIEKGYDKHLIDTPYPDTDDGFYRDFKYEIDGENIIRVWSKPIAFGNEGDL